LPIYVLRCTSVLLLFFFLMIPPTPRSTLFPYTTLFRSFPCEQVLETDHGDAAVLQLFHLLLERLRRDFGSRITHFVDQAVIAKEDRKSTRLNSSHLVISYAVFCLKKKKNK